eukprot:63010-Chlamydomonas_euryale.AAC.1
MPAEGSSGSSRRGTTLSTEMAWQTSVVSIDPDAHTVTEDEVTSVHAYWMVLEPVARIASVDMKAASA